MNPIEKIRLLPRLEKVRLLAQWFSKDRIENHKNLNLLFTLDDEYDKVYKNNRIKIGFSNANIMALEHVVSFFI